VSEQKTALRVTVHGRVQGVFYRDWTVGSARELGLAGWVRNRDDGTVEALLQGREATVRQMVERMRDGPPAARVQRIDEVSGDPEPLGNFSRRKDILVVHLHGIEHER
jgi:acylphosphatase